MNPTGQHGSEQGQQVLLNSADGGGQGVDDGVQAHLLNHVLEGSRGMARDPAQGLRRQGDGSVGQLMCLGQALQR